MSNIELSNDMLQSAHIPKTLSICGATPFQGGRGIAHNTNRNTKQALTAVRDENNQRSTNALAHKEVFIHSSIKFSLINSSSS